jgi:hypothetical protein
MTTLLNRVDHHLREYLMGHQSATRTVWRILFGMQPTPTTITALDPKMGW